MEVKDEDILARERARFERTGRLSALHWLVVAASVLITLLAWHLSRTALDERVSMRFEREAERVVDLFTEQLQRHADILQATASLFTARGEDIGHAEWRRYHTSLDLPRLFPALGALTVLHRVRADEVERFLARRREQYPGYALHPAHDRPFHLPVLHSAKSTRDPALGFDMAHDAVRRDAVERALRTGSAQITAPIHLTYSDTRGFLMFAPFYRGDENDWQNPGTGGLAGAALAVVRTESLAAGVLDRDKRLVWVHISDAGETLYDEHDEAHAGADAEPMFSDSVTVPLFGREWRFDIESTAAFRADAASIEPSLILAGGLLIDALLFGLFAMLSKANRRALSFADRTAARLHRRTEELETSNRTLESFAHVVSHDLKTPLNGIATLTGFLEEDLEALAANEATWSEVRDHVRLIHREVHRGQALIGGILEYSGLGAGETRSAAVDVRSLVEDIGRSLNAGPDRLVPEGDFPVLLTDETRLSQVLTNLVGNAFKYHHDAARARVVVRTEASGDRQLFSVADDGPGIAPAYHERVFELFQTLERRDDIDGTGVGLSIVRKTVEAMEGTVSIDSAPGRGSTFTFDWPRRVAGADDASAAARNAATEALPKAA